MSEYLLKHEIDFWTWWSLATSMQDDDDPSRHCCWGRMKVFNCIEVPLRRDCFCCILWPTKTNNNRIVIHCTTPYSSKWLWIIARSMTFWWPGHETLRMRCRFKIALEELITDSWSNGFKFRAFVPKFLLILKLFDGQYYSDLLLGASYVPYLNKN